jgi:cytochrome c553
MRRFDLRLAVEKRGRVLRILALTLAASIFVATAALADDVPFATPPSSRSGHTVAALADIMGKIQLRHIKLWQALRSKNWDLLDYELGQTRESFDTAVVLYNAIPIELIVAADRALGALQQAVKAKDGSNLERRFADLTAACNSCHEAAGIGFIAIKTPGPSPFSDQEFSPQK